MSLYLVGTIKSCTELGLKLLDIRLDIRLDIQIKSDWLLICFTLVAISPGSITNNLTWNSTRLAFFSSFYQVQDIQVQLQSKAEGDDAIMMALNKKVEEWKVSRNTNIFQKLCFVAQNYLDFCIQLSISNVFNNPKYNFGIRDQKA